jgi:hypothetical protein
MIKNETMKLEPTWSDILRMVHNGVVELKDTNLEKVCVIADTITHAQINDVTLTFYPDGTMKTVNKNGREIHE